jgi:hypothetical protein
MKEIVPSLNTTTVTITKMKIDVIRIELFKSATIYVSFETDAGEQVKGQCLELTGPIYGAWGNDDDYLYLYAATELGYTIKRGQTSQQQRAGQSPASTTLPVITPVVAEEDPALEPTAE